MNLAVLWTLNLLDARRNAVSEAFGNGLWVQNAFDPLTGRPTTRQAGTGGQSTNVQNLSYQWDPAGNLTSRQDLRQALTESFTYDALDRLTLAAGPGAQSTALVYDSIGNLQSKTGVGSYTYHPTRRHAVTSAGGTSYGYDANGNMTSRGGATIGWSSYNLPTSINAPGGYSAQFAYAPDRSRWRQVSSYAGGTETTIYVGGVLEKLTTPVRTHWKHLIATPSGQVQVIRRSDGTSETLYVTTDHLGSTDAVLDAAGTPVLQGSFAVHGERRAGDWQGAPSSGEWQSIAATTRRGYTGHEMLDNVALIHMNGRVLDPALGRFLSADPYIDGPLSTQGWNRYAYVHGRVMSATDPSGYGSTRYRGPQQSNGWTPASPYLTIIYPDGYQVGYWVPGTGKDDDGTLVTTFIPGRFYSQRLLRGGGILTMDTSDTDGVGGGGGDGGTGDRDPESSQGQWPVPGQCRLNEADPSRRQGGGQFGDPRVGAGGRRTTHEGIDIAAPEGNPIVAAFDGTIVSVQPNPSSTYGYQVVLSVPGVGYIQHAHLSNPSSVLFGTGGIVPGSQVPAGTLLGRVGRTGNLPARADSHLHLEYRFGPGPFAPVADPLSVLPPCP